MISFTVAKWRSRRRRRRESDGLTKPSPDAPPSSLNLPNVLTCLRIVAGPVILLWFFIDPRSPGPFVVFVFAAMTDFLDGWTARRFGQITPIGRILDPIADKTLTISVLLGLASTPLGGDWVFLAAAAAIVLREVSVAALRAYLRWSNAPTRLSVTNLAKWKTIMQFTALGALIASVALSSADLELFGLCVLWIAAGLTIVTGWDYFAKAFVLLMNRSTGAGS